MIGFTVLALLGTISLITGLVFGIIEDPGAKRAASGLTLAGSALLGIAAVVVARAAVRDGLVWLRDYFPNAERREEIAAAARELGLESLGREATTLDPAFKFADGVRRIDWVFAGSWYGLDVKIFDCWRLRKDWRARRDAEQWTCAILPVEGTPSQITISRETVVSRLRSMVGWGDVTFGDEAFDRAFRVEAASEDNARRLINDRVRSRVMEDAPNDPVAIQIQGHRMLYCCARLPIEDRHTLLEIAKRLHDAFPVS